MSYLSNISEGIRTTVKGMGLAISYFFEARKGRKEVAVVEENYFEKADGIFTVQYPKESIPIPDNGRYQLHNEIDDCIVCDKCAKICPVDCIDIEPVRSPEVFGQTSDGTPLRIHAAKFDIDMAKCCFCGLCTVVCPTECLTMTKEFDFSTTDILDHNFSFSKMSEAEIGQKKQEFEDFQLQKQQPKSDLPAIKKSTGVVDAEKGNKPVFKPKIPTPKPVVKSKIAGAKPIIKPKQEQTDDSGSSTAKKPVIKPVIKPKLGGQDQQEKRPVIKPVIKPKTATDSQELSGNSDPQIHETGNEKKPNAAKKPIIKPKIPKKK